MNKRVEEKKKMVHAGSLYGEEGTYCFQFRAGPGLVFH